MKDGIDLELIQRCKEGDHSAFEKLFYLCKDSVYNIALRFTGNRQDAEDLTQEGTQEGCWLDVWTVAERRFGRNLRERAGIEPMLDDASRKQN